MIIGRSTWPLRLKLVGAVSLDVPVPWRPICVVPPGAMDPL